MFGESDTNKDAKIDFDGEYRSAAVAVAQRQASGTNVVERYILRSAPQQLHKHVFAFPVLEFLKMMENVQ